MSQQRVSPATRGVVGAYEPFAAALFMQVLAGAMSDIIVPTGIGKHRPKSEPQCGKVNIAHNSSMRKRMRAMRRGVLVQGGRHEKR